MTSPKHNNLIAQTGFTLIELMIVVAIIGILASVAISSYQNYAIRVQVSEGLNLAAGAKTSVVDSFLQSGEAPVNRTQAGMTPEAEDTFSKYVAQINVANGRIDVVYGNDANLVINNTTLTLTPYQTEDRSIVWRCALADIPTNSGGSALSTMGASTGGTSATYSAGSVEPRYLPSVCRP